MTRQKTFIIAEAGVNHNGNREFAEKLVDLAAEAGADAVKFQTFKADKVAIRSAPKADYQLQTTEKAEAQTEMLRKLELTEELHHVLVERCKKRSIQFLSTPFDPESVTLLADKIGVDLIKIPSGEITNGPLLLSVARTGKPVIMSSGMAVLGDLEDALSVLAFGYLRPKAEPESLEDCRKAFATPEGRAVIQKNASLLHCTSEYPAPFNEVNLKAMDVLRAAFGLPVGLSDHTPGISIPIAAVARGATIIEKHFTLDKKLPGPDHKASLDPAELVAMVRSIREVEVALGDGHKIPTACEIRNRPIIRRSLVAGAKIKAGERFTAANIACKRPGDGVSPLMYWQYLGKVATRDYEFDEFIGG